MRILLQHCESVLFDLWNGTKTFQRVSLARLDIPFANKALGEEYAPSPVYPLRKLLGEISKSAEDVFVDFGCGKGRALLVASDFPFKRIVGVEFSRELCGIARENVERYRRRHPGMPPVEILESDVGEVIVDPDWTVLYFYSPFKAEVTRQIMRKIEASYASHPRRICVVYLQPASMSVFDSCAFLRLERTLRIMACEFLIYETADGALASNHQVESHSRR